MERVLTIFLPECGTCHGSGELTFTRVVARKKFPDSRPCPDCGGRGWLIPDELVREVKHHLKTAKSYSADFTATEHAEQIVAAVLSVIEGDTE